MTVDQLVWGIVLCVFHKTRLVAKYCCMVRSKYVAVVPRFSI